MLINYEPTKSRPSHRVILSPLISASLNIGRSVSFSEGKCILLELLKKSFVNKAFIFSVWNGYNEFVEGSLYSRSMRFFNKFRCNYLRRISIIFLHVHSCIYLQSFLILFPNNRCHRVNYHPSITKLNHVSVWLVSFLVFSFSLANNFS